MRVLFHQAWQQPIGDNSPAILIEGGNTMGAQHELKGFIAFSQGKTLDLVTHLWVSQLSPTSPTSASPHPDAGSVSAIPIAHNHRIKPGEIHYLDHPIFGILVRVRPLEDL